MKRLKQNNEIYEVGFELNIINAIISVRFPCTFFMAIRNNANKMIARTSHDDISSKDGVAVFNQALTFKTYLLYDPQLQAFCRKQINLGLYLISQRKPDEQKLVGRVKIDLGDVIDQNVFADQDQHKLEFSSIKDAAVTFSMKVLSQEKTDMTLNQLDMESFSNLDLSVSRDVGYEEIHKNSKFSQNKSQRSSNIQAIEEEIIHIREQKSKLEIQNKRLLGIIQSNNSNLQNYEQKQCDQVSEEVALLKNRIKQVQNEKNDIVQELLAQIQQETKSRIELQNKLSQVNQKEGQQESQQIINLKERILELEAEFQESQKIRLQVQTQNLDIKYELSELKALQAQYISTIEEKDLKINQLLDKDTSQHQKHLLEGTEELKALSTENQNLRQKIEQMTLEIQCAEAGTSRLDEVSQAYTNLLNEHDLLTQKLNQAIADKQKIEEEKRELEQRILKPGQSEILNEQLSKNLISIQSEVERLREQIIQHQEFRHKSQLAQKNLEEQLTNALSKLREQKQQNASLLKEITESSDQIRSLKDKLQTSQQQLLNIEHEKKNANEQATQLHLKIENLENYIQERDNEIEQQRSHIKEQNKEVRTANQTIKQLEVQIKILEGQIKQNQRNKEEGMEVIKDLRDQVSELNKLRTQYINKEMKQNNEMKTIRNKMEKVTEQFRTKQATISQKNIIIDHLNRQIEDEIRKCQELEERISKFAEKQMQMRENIFVLEEESKKIYDIVVEQENVLESQDYELSEKDDEIGMLKMQNAEIIQRNMKIQQDNNVLRKQIYQLKNQQIEKLPVLESTQTPGQLFSAEQKLKKLLTNQQSRINQLEKVLQDKNQDTVKKIKQFNRNIQLLEEQKKNLEQKIIELNSEKGQFKKEKDELNEKIRRQQFTIEELNTKIQNINEELGTSKGSQNRELLLKKEEYHFLQNKNQALLGEIQKLEKRISEQGKEIQDYIGRIQQLQMSQAQGGESAPNPVNLINERNLTRQNEDLKKNLQEFEEQNNKLTQQIANLEKIKAKGSASQAPQVTGKKLDTSSNSHASTISSTSKELKNLIKERSTKAKAEEAVQILVNNNKMLEDSMSKIIQERGMIQENTRKLSLEFQKIKANLLKSKASMQDKRELLNSLKPCEQKVKDLIGMAENLSEFINMIDEPVDE